ncbi:helix-turn-helix domain-containing protein [Paenibacillus glucanolyticus]|uniref:helix-turn-helix domain-containing protein n=1 Tax=Paenibacillus glucanolyticus TaxID=59843 RepID=UPI00128B280F|nr:helix-turn-helix transcriptional regulator [Paenibacillus glucanolyticus]MPY20254.1 helix-turn-helix transcriptional regulator [Paenibacillus glucanolyticus]
MSLGFRIKDLRKDKKITQRELAQKLEIDNTTVSKWEADIYEPDTNTLNKLADLFEVTTDYLLGRTDNPKGYETNMSFYGGPENYTEDEIEEMEAALERYRAMKRRAAEQAEKDSKK